MWVNYEPKESGWYILQGREFNAFDVPARWNDNGFWCLVDGTTFPHTPNIITKLLRTINIWWGTFVLITPLLNSPIK